MATQVEANLAAPNGTALTTTNGGGSTLTSVTAATNTTFAGDSGLLFAGANTVKSTPGTGTQIFCTFSGIAAGTVYARAMVYFDSAPGGSSNVNVLRFASTTNANQARCVVTPSMTVLTQHAANVNGNASSTVLSTSTWYRIEAQMIGSTTSASLTVRIYDNSGTLLETVTDSGISGLASATVDRVDTGQSGSSLASVDTWHVARFAVSDSNWCGPASIACTGSASVTLTASANITGPSFACTGTASVTLTASANDALKFPATASAAVTLTASANISGPSFATTGSASITLTGSATDVLSFATTGSASITLTASGGITFAPIPTTGAGSIELTAQAACTLTVYKFQTPSNEYMYPNRERLWALYYRLAHGVSVIRWQDGTYSAVETVSTDEFDEAAFIYLGGHVYDIDASEAANLTAAGFGDGVASVVISGPPAVPPYTPYDPPTGGGGGGGEGGGFGFGSGGFGTGGFGF